MENKNILNSVISLAKIERINSLKLYFNKLIGSYEYLFSYYDIISKVLSIVKMLSAVLALNYYIFLILIPTTFTLSIKTYRRIK